MTEAELKDRLLAAMRKRGLPVNDIGSMRRLTGGAMQETWRINTSSPSPYDSLILRRASDRDEPRPGTVSLRVQAELTEASRIRGVPGPVVLAILEDGDGLGKGFVMCCVEGETIPQRILKLPILAKARETLADECGRILAALHATPSQALPELPHVTAAERLQTLYAQYRRQGRNRPVFELAFSWLRRRLPPSDIAPTLVHGDFRNGNLIIDASGVAAVLDWERAFIGDPMFDIGWLCTGSWRFGALDNPVGGFGSIEALASAYQAKGGRFDLDRVRFWEAYGSLDWGVTTVDLAIEAEETGAIETAAIGRRTTETEIDLLRLMRDHG
jgi:aminoglycoside phosphotransferase (APT) family kinase protein